jgi:hypothetical protein
MSTSSSAKSPLSIRMWKKSLTHELPVFARSVSFWNVYLRVTYCVNFQNDKGGSTLLNNYWTTFLKARLNCSLPGAHPYYFNYIRTHFRKVYSSDDSLSFLLQRMSFLMGDHSLRYLPWTRKSPTLIPVILFPDIQRMRYSRGGLASSAVCRYDFSQVERFFEESHFQEQPDVTKFWQKVDDSKVPSPRPGLVSSFLCYGSVLHVSSCNIFLLAKMIKQTLTFSICSVLMTRKALRAVFSSLSGLGQSCMSRFPWREANRYTM